MSAIREAMEAKGMTFEQVASEAGLSVRTVYNAADGKRANKSTKKLLAAALDAPIEILFPAIKPNYCSNSQEPAA